MDGLSYVIGILFRNIPIDVKCSAVARAHSKQIHQKEVKIHVSYDWKTSERLQQKDSTKEFRSAGKCMQTDIHR